MTPQLAQKLAQEIGSLVVQCHALQADLDEAKAHIAELESARKAEADSKVPQPA